MSGEKGGPTIIVAGSPLHLPPIDNPHSSHFLLLLFLGEDDTKQRHRLGSPEMDADSSDGKRASATATATSAFSSNNSTGRDTPIIFKLGLHFYNEHINWLPKNENAIVGKPKKKFAAITIAITITMLQMLQFYSHTLCHKETKNEGVFNQEEKSTKS